MITIDLNSKVIGYPKRMSKMMLFLTLHRIWASTSILHASPKHHGRFHAGEWPLWTQRGFPLKAYRVASKMIGYPPETVPNVILPVNGWTLKVFT